MRHKALVSTLVGLTLSLAGATAAHAGAKLKISDEAEIDLGFRLQVLAKFTDSDVVSGGDYESFDDFQIRRARFRLTGTVNEYFSMFLQTDVSGNSVQMIDAYVHFKTDPRFQVFVGQHLVPANRQNVTSSGTLLAIDRPGNIYKSITWGGRALSTFDTATYSDSASGFSGPAQVRDTGITLWGTGDISEKVHYKYYVGTYDGIPGAGHDAERYAGRVQLNFGDAEPSFYSTANYLGKKDTIGVGLSYDTQADVLPSAAALTDYTYYSADVFVSKGPVTFEAAYMDLDLDGVKPAAEGDGYYAQFGYMIPNSKWQPWALYERFDADASNGKGSYDLWRIGVSYFLKGHNANIKAGFESFKADAPIGSGTEDTINSFVIGFYTTY